MHYCQVYVCSSSLPVIPYVRIIPPQSVTVQSGRPSSMTCVIVGDYNSKDTPWTHKGVKVENGSGVTVGEVLRENSMGIFSLTFMNVTDNGVFGDYTCDTGLGKVATATLIKAPGELAVSCYSCGIQ